MRATTMVFGSTPAPVSTMPGTKAEPRCRNDEPGAVDGAAVATIEIVEPMALLAPLFVM